MGILRNSFKLTWFRNFQIEVYKHRPIPFFYMEEKIGILEIGIKKNLRQLR